MTPPDAPLAHFALRPDPVAGVPFLTGEVGPIGGVIKQRPEDFIVDELPQYDPCGEGEHIYLYVEKSGLSTMQLVRIVAKHFHVDERAVGYAGQKDKHALTRQVISVHVPGKRAEDFPSITHDRVSVLWADHHTNKLRLGHLRGNRFSIRIRDVDPVKVVAAHKVMRILAATGLPNSFGPQRFGHRGNNHELGRLMLLGDWQGFFDEFLGFGSRAGAPDSAEGAARARSLYTEGRFAEAADAFPHAMRHEIGVARALASGARPDKAIRTIHPVQMRFWISAFQSGIFNRFLSERIAAGAFDRVVPGDVAIKLRNGALFDVDELVVSDPETAHRLASFEIAPSGPLWGPKMKRCSGEPGALEDRVLAETGVTLDRFARLSDQFRVDMPGARRPVRVPVTDIELDGGMDEHGGYIRVAFDLPPGSFATSVIREITKADAMCAPELAEEADHG